MKKKGEKQADVLKPSPNEEAHLIHSEREKRKKLRLKQIRDQEKAFSRQVLENGRKRKTAELQHLTQQLKGKWQSNHDEEQEKLKKKYQENVAEFGLGHNTAAQDRTDYSTRKLTEEERERIVKRYKTALQQLLCDRAKLSESETERFLARQRAIEIERLRAARIASLPPSVDPIADLYLSKGSPSTRLASAVDQTWRLFKREDAREAAKDEEHRLQVIMEGVERDKAEQLEKARLRHKHALGLQQLEEDHKKLLKELDSLERYDRQRRQEAVAKIPVRIFQPPHKRLEDAEERQQELEQAFEDMYMTETGYTGDVTIALEPTGRPPFAPEDSIQSASDGEEKAREVTTEKPHELPTEIPGIPSAAVPHRGTDMVEHERGQSEREPATSEPPKVPNEDPLRRLLQRIEKQREQWQRRQAPQDTQASTATAGIPRISRSGIMAPSRRQEFRIPETVFISEQGSDSDVESAADEEEEEEEPRRVETAAEEPGGVNQNRGAVPQPSGGTPGARTLLHPLEAAQRSRGATTPMEITPSPEMSQQEGVLKQQQLKLQLQQQSLLEQQLQQQLQEYQRQLRDIRAHPEVPTANLVHGEEESRSPEIVPLEEPLPVGAPYSEGPLGDSTLELSEVSRGELPSPVHVKAPHRRAPSFLGPGGISAGGSHSSDAPESSTLGSVTSDETEFSSEFRRTLEAARATAERAAQVREKERATLDELSRVPLEDVPFPNGTQSARDSSSVSTVSLQSEELRSESGPSSISPTCMTLSSDLSVTAAMSHISQPQILSRDIGRFAPVTPTFSEITDTINVTAVTSLVTKTSQNLGLLRPSSQSAPTYSVLSTESESGTRISSALPSSVRTRRVITDQRGGLSVGPSALPAFTSGTTQLRAPQTSSVSIPSQLGRSTYSPGYLEYYRQKIEEERHLFEEQRDRIRQRQSEQMKRYGDVLKKSSQSYQVSYDVGNSGHPVVPQMEVNKENRGFMANTSVFRGQERLERMSRRLDTFEKSLNGGTVSYGDPSSFPRAALPAVVSTSRYTSKPFSTSGLSNSSSWTEYLSLPRESAGPGRQASTGSTLSSLSELTEMMTRLTSTSEDTSETDDKPTNTYSVPGQHELKRAQSPRDAFTRNALGLSVNVPYTAEENLSVSKGTGRSSDPHYHDPGYSMFVSSVTSSADLTGAPYKVAQGDELWYAPSGTSSASSGTMGSGTVFAKSALRRDSTEEQRDVPLEMSTLPSVATSGRMNIQAMIGGSLHRVFHGDGYNSAGSGATGPGSVESSSPSNLSSGTLRFSPSGKPDDSSVSTDPQEPPLAIGSPNSDLVIEDSSPQHSDSHNSVKETVSVTSEEIVEDISETREGAVSLQAAFATRKADFMKKSQARVEKAKEKRFQVKPRVKVKQMTRRPAASTKYT